MFSDYPEQTAARKGFVLLGTFLRVFGLAMAVFYYLFMAAIGIGFALSFLLPAVFCGRASFAAVDPLLSRIFAGC